MVSLKPAASRLGAKRTWEVTVLARSLLCLAKVWRMCAPILRPSADTVCTFSRAHVPGVISLSVSVKDIRMPDTIWPVAERPTVGN